MKDGPTAIAVENERDEDVNDGLVPQLPAGHCVSIVDASSGEVLFGRG